MNYLSALSYPFLRGGWIMIVLGAIFSALLGLINHGYLGLLVGVFSAGYFGSFYISIINRTIMGEDHVPDWPSFSSFLDDILSPFLRLFGLVIVSFLPVFILQFFWDDTRDWVAPAMIVAIVWGCFYFPMAVLATLAFGGIGAASPHIVLPAIIRCMPVYLLVIIALVAGFGITLLVQHFTGRLPYLGWFLAASVGLYSMMFQGRLIGLLYRENAWKLGWS